MTEPVKTLLTEQDLYDAATIEALYGLIGKRHQQAFLERAVRVVLYGVEHAAGDAKLLRIVETARDIARA